MLLALGFSGVGWARGLPQRPPRPASTAGVGYLSFNVCGGACRHGEVATTARDVAKRAERRGVGVVLLQELCYSQFRRVRALLARRGFTGRFEAQANSPACANDDARHGTGFGVAVLVRGPLARGVIRQLPASPSDPMLGPVVVRFTELAEGPSRNPEISDLRAEAAVGPVREAGLTSGAGAA